MQIFDLRKVLILWALLALMTTLDTAAYIDPGAGSYLFQLMIGGITGLFFLITNFRKKIAPALRSFLSRKTTVKNRTLAPEMKSRDLDAAV